jgi:hypothetical protein
VDYKKAQAKLKEVGRTEIISAVLADENIKELPPVPYLLTRSVKQLFGPRRCWSAGYKLHNGNLYAIIVLNKGYHDQRTMRLKLN